MAISQPISTDQLNSPDHSLMHRQIATDPSAGAQSITVNSASIVAFTNPLPIASGGSGQVSAQLAINAFAGGVTANRVLRGDGNNILLAQVALATDVTGTLPVGNGGTGATAAANAASGVVVLDGSSKLPAVDGSALTNLPTQTPGANTITATMLKTATSEVNNNGGSATNYTVTGGQYCHYPQVKATGTTHRIQNISIVSDSATFSTQTYTTNVMIYAYDGSSDVFAIFLYHTSSGEDYWLWLLVDKLTKKVLSMASAPDHPAYGNSNDFDKQPHPFPDFNVNTQDMILIEKEQAKTIQLEAKKKHSSVLELVSNNYKIDFTELYNYTPIHSGQYSPEETPVLVERIPNYIQVRKLIKK